MERKQAVIILAKLLGKNFAYEVHPDAPTKEMREEAKAALPAFNKQYEEQRKRVDERREQILNSDPVYQAMLSELTACRKAKEKLSSTTYRYKFVAGTVEGIAGFRCFHIKASGDSWEEVIAAIKAKK